jgi:hypothetical protein
MELFVKGVQTFGSIRYNHLLCDTRREAETRLRIPGARLSSNDLLSYEENYESKADHLARRSLAESKWMQAAVARLI